MMQQLIAIYLQAKLVGWMDGWDGCGAVSVSWCNDVFLPSNIPPIFYYAYSILYCSDAMRCWL